MAAVQLAAPVIAFLVLAAHFYRSGNFVAVLACILVAALVFARRPWVARALQVGLLLGSLEWLRSTVTLVLARTALGEPYLRLALILGGVTLLTALAALVFRTQTLRAYFGFMPSRDPD